MDTEILRKLEKRLEPLHARQRLGIEKDHEAQVFGQGLTFFHLSEFVFRAGNHSNGPQADGTLLAAAPKCRTSCC
jgi:hypothetical protein